MVKGVMVELARELNNLQECNPLKEFLSFTSFHTHQTVCTNRFSSKGNLFRHYALS